MKIVKNLAYKMVKIIKAVSKLTVSYSNIRLIVLNATKLVCFWSFIVWAIVNWYNFESIFRFKPKDKRMRILQL